jgi:hypothetical protein
MVAGPLRALKLSRGLSAKEKAKRWGKKGAKSKLSKFRERL